VSALCISFLRQTDVWFSLSHAKFALWYPTQAARALGFCLTVVSTCPSLSLVVVASAILASSVSMVFWASGALAARVSVMQTQK
jgi:hypothetical protein